MSSDPKVALLPLDERPVNTGLVQEVARIAGYRCELPGQEILPSFRTPGNTDALADWLKSQSEDADAIVASLDTLVYGGLIPARTTNSTVEESVGRLHTLREIHEAKPDLPMLAVSLVTRASDSYVSVEEPEYWSDWGRDLHHHGGETHRAWVGQEDDESNGVKRDVPSWVLEDFARRRLRNHIVNLAALQMRWDEVLDYLAITADDTAEFSAGSAEQSWLEYWRIFGAPTLPVIGYPGADETGAVLMARAITTTTGTEPRIKVATGTPASLKLIPPYENGPIGESITRQISAAGGKEVDEEEADMILVVHGPDPDRGDNASAQSPSSDPRETTATVEVVREALSTGLPVVLADVRFVNGGDTQMIEALAEQGLLSQLAAYGGWNTAGNALGAAVATGVAIVVGTLNGTLDSRAQQIALRRRLMDDVAYQALIRRDLMTGVFEGSFGPVSAKALDTAAAHTVATMNDYLSHWGLADGYVVQSVEFPWKRSFEVDIHFS
ncbi:DUF4127 family protein [Actinomycetaceae bacterium MB13-C1-2]|nr:DUF4127 family protein [Actinomycetaceae bacterium MB13-C1-2]